MSWMRSPRESWKRKMHRLVRRSCLMLGWFARRDGFFVITVAGTLVVLGLAAQLALAVSPIVLLSRILSSNGYPIYIYVGLRAMSIVAVVSAILGLAWIVVAPSRYGSVGGSSKDRRLQDPIRGSAHKDRQSKP